MLEQGYPYFEGRGPLSRRQLLHVGTWAGLGIAAGAMSGAAPWPQQVWAQQTSDTLPHWWSVDDVDRRGPA